MTIRELNLISATPRKIGIEKLGLKDLIAISLRIDEGWEISKSLLPIGYIPISSMEVNRENNDIGRI